MEDADPEVVNLLTKCKLDKYIDIFKENSIDSETLHLLDEDGIKDLIPSVGHRIKFKSALNSWKEEQESLVNSYFNFEKRTLTSSTLVTTTKDVDKNNHPVNTNIDTHTHLVNIPHEPPSSTVVTTTEDVDKNNHESLDGRAILKEGKNSGGLLKESFRRKLSQIIILDALENNPSRAITTEEFNCLASEICEIFPKEFAVVYYSPYASASSHRAKKNASGKLYETYISKRRTFRARGDLPSGTSRSSSTNSTRTITHSDDNNGMTEHSDEHNDDENIEEKLAFLRNNVDPWTTVEEHWTETQHVRLKPILNGHGNIADYIKEFPAIQQPLGYTLLMKDFCHLYGTKENELFTNIVLLREKIIEIAKTKLTTVRDKYIKNCISEYLSLVDENDPETITNVALILLSYVINLSPARKNTGRGKWKPSRSEIRDGYITQAASESDVGSIIQMRRAKLLKLGRTLQPLIIFVGESIAQVKCAYVVVNDTLYHFKKLLTAVDTAFKVFQATGACYPEESADIWLVIQMGFYKIKTRFDRPTQAVNSLLADISLLNE